ncbi:putative arginine-tRNA ligase, mitochondrial isoform X1 [Arapaima gigas]
MACFFRRSIASQLAKVLRQSEESFISCIFAIPVSKKQLSYSDFRLSLSRLRENGCISSAEDIQMQAEGLARQLKPDNVIEEVTVGHGVINFKINRSVLAQEILKEASNGKDSFGLRSELFRGHKKGRTLVEFSSPNIAKKFHAGHLRSTIIGNFIANIKEALGNDVIRMNYLGDWGLQFGLLGTGFQRFGSEQKLKENPLQHLFDVYVQVNREMEREEGILQAAREFFRDLEQGAEEPLSLWRLFREITVEEYKRVYSRLRVHFDEYSGESFHQNQTLDLVQQLQVQGLLKTTEKGTSVVDLSPAQDMSYYCTVLRSDGTSLYITRQIALHHTTDKSQADHFQQLFQILLTMGYQWAQSCSHVPFGLVQGMKTRQGEVVFLVDVLDEVRNRMLKNMQESMTTKDLEDPEDTAEKVGIAALIVQDFKGPLESDYKFDWDRVLQSQGDTGVFLQYTHSRLCSLMRMHGNEGEGPFEPRLLQESQGTAVLRHLLRYDEILWQTSHDLQPKYLVNFLMTLSHLVAAALKALPVKGSPPALAQARLQLFSCACSVLASGMRILGISPVEKM